MSNPNPRRREALVIHRTACGKTIRGVAGRTRHDKYCDECKESDVTVSYLDPNSGRQKFVNAKIMPAIEFARYAEKRGAKALKITDAEGNLISWRSAVKP